MPDWYPAFEASNVLHVPAWSMAGFTYDNPADAPICWREWALEFLTAKAAARAHAIRESNR